MFLLKDVYNGKLTADYSVFPIIPLLQEGEHQMADMLGLPKADHSPVSLPLTPNEKADNAPASPYPYAAVATDFQRNLSYAYMCFTERLPSIEAITFDTLLGLFPDDSWDIDIKSMLDTNYGILGYESWGKTEILWKHVTKKNTSPFSVNMPFPEDVTKIVNYMTKKGRTAYEENEENFCLEYVQASNFLFPTAKMSNSHVLPIDKRFYEYLEIFCPNHQYDDYTYYGFNPSAFFYTFLIANGVDICGEGTHGFKQVYINDTEIKQQIINLLNEGLMFFQEHVAFRTLWFKNYLDSLQYKNLTNYFTCPFSELEDSIEQSSSTPPELKDQLLIALELTAMGTHEITSEYPELKKFRDIDPKALSDFVKWLSFPGAPDEEALMAQVIGIALHNPFKPPEMYDHKICSLYLKNTKNEENALTQEAKRKLDKFAKKNGLPPTPKRPNKSK